MSVAKRRLHSALPGGRSLALAPVPPGPHSDAAAHLIRDAVESLPAGELERLLELGRPLRVKLGIDPTAPDIHLGHTVVLRKLREFQDAGHIVVLIIGDFTARVGDPSGRSEVRPVLSAEEIEANASTFVAQASKVLDSDPGRLELRHNSEWLQLKSDELLRLLGTTTAGSLLERDDFANRREAQQPISMLELLYPLLQGYDSVAVAADVEVGGTDQKFNLLLARHIQKSYGQAQQAILTMPILPGISGDGRKMSKSLGNHIGVTEAPEEMYGKTLRVPDELLPEYFGLLLGHEPPAELSPRDAKRLLARELVARFHSPAEAEQAESRFDRVHVDHGVPDDIEELEVSGSDGPVHLPALLEQAFGYSRSHARRQITQGGVHLDGVAIDELDIEPAQLDGRVLAAGKRSFRRLRVSG